MRNNGLVEILPDEAFEEMGVVPIDNGTVIDTFEVKKGNTTLYLDEESYNEHINNIIQVSINERKYADKIKQDANKMKQEVFDIFRSLEKNNPLDKIKDINDYKNKKIINNSEERFEKINYTKTKVKRNKSKKRGFSLRRVAVYIGLIFGFFSAAKTTSNYHVSGNSDVTVDYAKTTKPEKEETKVKQTKVEQQRKSIESQINELKEIKNTIIEDVKLKDNITLNNATFHYTSDYCGPKVSQEKVDCDSYTINRIAILSKSSNEIIDVIDINNKNKNMSIDDLKDNVQTVYGDDVKIKINVNGIKDGEEIYKHLGWTSINKVEEVEKVYTKKR